MPSLNGLDFNNLSVFAFRNGTLTPIPFQFEDMDIDGNTYFVKGEAPLRGQKDIFDNHDALFFLLADTGDQLTPFPRNNTHVLSEVKITLENTSRYVYVATGMSMNPAFATDDMSTVKNATNLSPSKYVHFNKDTGLIETSQYSLQTDPENFLLWSQLRYHDMQTDEDNNILDSLKIRMSAGILAKYPRLTLTNKNFFMNVLDVKDGPVRSIILLSGKVKVAGFTVLYVNFHVAVLPSELELEVRVRVPSIFKHVIHSPNTSLSLECRNIKGGIFRTSLGPVQPAIIDGHISPLEQSLIQKGIDNDHTWIWVSTRKNLDVFATMFISKNFTAPISLYYRDEKPNESNANLGPNDNLGSNNNLGPNDNTGPNIGYRIHDIPVDVSFKFQFNIIMSGDIGELEPQQFSQNYKTQPNIAVYNNFKAIKLAKRDLLDQ